MFERGTAVEADTRNAGNRKFDQQHITRLAGWVVTGCTVDGAHDAVREGFGVETGSSLGVLIVPTANDVLGHCESFLFQRDHAPSRSAFVSMRCSLDGRRLIESR